MNLFSKSIIVFGLSVAIPVATYAQFATTTLPADFYQFLLQQQQANPFTQFQQQFSASSTIPATTTTPTIEDVIFQKNAVPVLTPAQAQAQIGDRNVVLGDDIVINLTTQRDPATPIDLFVLAFDSVGFPTKRVFLKTVFNDQIGVTKKYRITINQDLLNELNTATSMRIGYCIGGCKSAAAKLILGKVILPTQFTVETTTPLGTQQTF